MRRKISLSEEIKITVVIENEKTPQELRRHEEKTRPVTHEPGETLLSDLRRNGLVSEELCAGHGTCGRCRIVYVSRPPVPTPIERRLLTPEELRHGVRLACMCRPKEDCVIRPAFIASAGTDIVSHMIAVSENNDQTSQSQKSTTNDMTSDITNVTETVIAADLGTTTIAMQLRETVSGKVLDTFCTWNPQRSYGADVLSRIQAACGGAGEQLRRMVREILEQGVRQLQSSLQQSCGQKARISRMCIAGNTTMVHLLLGYEVSALGCSPFRPVSLAYEEADWGLGFPVSIVPGISAFVGGDVTAGLYALSMLSEQQKGEPELLIDLGTNGELVLRDGKRLIATATAAGPAFEGGAGAGVIGTDMVAVTAALVQAGIVDETGLMKEPYFTKGVTLTLREGVPVGIAAGYRSQRGERSVFIRKEDIRALQMAKAAVRAGTEILQRLSGKYPAKIFLAGGFGYYLDTEAAVDIGLLQERMRGRIQAVGNTALEGAYRIGRDLESGALTAERLEEQTRRAEAVNLAEQKDFEMEYLQHMGF